MDDENYGFSHICCIMGGILVGAFCGYWTGNKIPATDNVQVGYVIPNKLEIKVEDLRNDGQSQTIVKYDGKSYLFTLDERGEPRIQDYEIRPREIYVKPSLDLKAEAEIQKKE